MKNRGALKLFSVGLISLGIGFAGSWLLKQRSYPDQSRSLGGEDASPLSTEDSPSPRITTSSAFSEFFAQVEAAIKRRIVFDIHFESGKAAQMLSVSDFPAVVAELEKREDKQWSTVTLIVMLRWAKLHPESLTHFINSGSVDLRRIGTFYMYWADGDTDAALGSIKKLEDEYAQTALHGIRSNQDQVVQNAIQEEGLQYRAIDNLENEEKIENALKSQLWKEDIERFGNMLFSAYHDDPKAATEVVLTIDDNAAISRLLRHVANMDWSTPTEGLEHFKGLYSNRSIESRSQYLHMIAQIVSSTGGKDIKSTINWLKQNLNETEMGTVLGNATQRGIHFAQPQSVLNRDLLDALPDSQYKRLAIQSMINQAVNHDWENTYNWILENSDSLDPETRVSIMSSAYHTQGAEAAFSIYEILPYHARLNAAQGLALNWNKQDIGTFVQWALEQKDASITNTSLKHIANRWVESDLEGALYFTENLPEGELKADYQKAIGSQLSEESIESALEFASTIDNRKVVSQIEYDVFQEWGKRAPTDAIDYINGVYSDEPRRIQNLMNVLAATVHWNPELVSKYLATEPNEQARQDGYELMTNRWINKSSEIQRDVRDLSESGADRNDMIYGLTTIPEHVRQFPHHARAAAESITDPAMQQRAKENVNRILDTVEDPRK